MTTAGREYLGLHFALVKDIHGSLTNILVSFPPLHSPREEKLFELGWKDDCYFYGDPETYMTLPSTLNAGRQLNNAMKTARGTTSISRNPAIVPQYVEPNENTTREDLDRFVNHSTFISDEDSFLPFHGRSSILSLPRILRKYQAHATRPDYLESPGDQFLSRKMAELSKKAERLADYVLPPLSDRANWSYGRFGRIDPGDQILPDDRRTTLELMPTLRRIAVLEQAAENAALLAADPENKSMKVRSTRRQAKARRHHHFDKVSSSLRRDEHALNSSEVGSLLAEMLMT